MYVYSVVRYIDIYVCGVYGYACVYLLEILDYGSDLVMNRVATCT